jgi:hypothetical protein
MTGPNVKIKRSRHRFLAGAAAATARSALADDAKNLPPSVSDWTCNRDNGVRAVDGIITPNGLYFERHHSGIAEVAACHGEFGESAGRWPQLAQAAPKNPSRVLKIMQQGMKL